MKIAAADYGNLAGNAHSGFEDGIDDSDGDRVVVTEHAIGTRRQSQQLLHGLVAAAPAIHIGRTSGQNVALELAQIVVREGLMITFRAPHGRTRGGAANVRDWTL